MHWILQTLKNQKPHRGPKNGQLPGTSRQPRKMNSIIDWTQLSRTNAVSSERQVHTQGESKGRNFDAESHTRSGARLRPAEWATERRELISGLVQSFKKKADRQWAPSRRCLFSQSTWWWWASTSKRTSKVFTSNAKDRIFIFDFWGLCNIYLQNLSNNLKLEIQNNKIFLKLF